MVSAHTAAAVSSSAAATTGSSAPGLRAVMGVPAPPQTREHQRVPVRAVRQEPADSADRRRGGAGARGDLLVGPSFGQHPRHGEALREGLHLADRTEILEKPIALV